MIHRSMFIATLLLAGAAFATEKPAAPQADIAKGQQIANGVCSGCHSADGNSQIESNPKLAGQGADYLYKQLSNFKSQNGQQPERTSAIMSGMVATLSEEDMRNVTAYYASVKQKDSTAKNQDTIALGQKLFRAGDTSKSIPACAGCHGPAGKGVPSLFPRVAGQHAEYTMAQLKAFRDGTRTNDPNGMMRAIALKMTDTEIKAVADYIAGLR